MHCLVTGASGGIGAAIVDSLAQAGHTVTAWDLADVDVTDASAVSAAVAELEVPVDALIHAAGILLPDVSLSPDPQALHQSISVNFFGVVNVCSAVAEKMVSRGEGAIVVVSSNASAVPRAGMAAYGASKAAATSWAKNLALECAPAGVRVNVVSPGSTDTSMLHGLTDEASSIAGDPDRYRLGIPLHRIADPYDIAGACAFLISPAARHITMHDLRVDGGATLDA